MRTNTKKKHRYRSLFSFVFIMNFSTNFQVSPHSVPPHYYNKNFHPLTLEYIRTRCQLRIGLMLHFIITISINFFPRFQVCSFHFICSKVRYFSAAKTRATNNNKNLLFFHFFFIFPFSTCKFISVQVLFSISTDPPPHLKDVSKFNVQYARRIKSTHHMHK